MARALAQRYAAATLCSRVLAAQATSLARTVANAAGLRQVRELYHHSRTLDEQLTRARNLDFRPLRMAIDDLVTTFGRRYPAGQDYQARLVVLQQALTEALAQLSPR